MRVDAIRECRKVIKGSYAPGPKLEFWMAGNLTVAQVKAFKVVGH